MQFLILNTNFRGVSWPLWPGLPSPCPANVWLYASVFTDSEQPLILYGRLFEPEMPSRVTNETYVWNRTLLYDK